MHSKDLRFQVSTLQREQQVALTNAILWSIFAVVTTAVAPQLLLEYVLQNATVQQQVMVLRYIPLIVYGLALLVFVVAMVRNFGRNRRIRMLQQEIQLLAFTATDCCCDGVCVSTKDMEAHASDEKAGASQDKSAKKTTSTKKKSTKKSTSSKK